MKSAAQALTGSGNYGFIFPAGKNRITSIFVKSNRNRGGWLRLRQ
jgi:hypothetical protein